MRAAGRRGRIVWEVDGGRDYASTVATATVLGGDNADLGPIAFGTATADWQGQWYGSTAYYDGSAPDWGVDADIHTLFLVDSPTGRGNLIAMIDLDPLRVMAGQAGPSFASGQVRLRRVNPVAGG